MKQNEKRIERIQTMESYLDECAEATKRLSAEVETMQELRSQMIALFSYYGSNQWYKDREADIPKDVKAEVLSEDLVYDEITEVRDLAFEMLELATDILKNRI